MAPDITLANTIYPATGFPSESVTVTVTGSENGFPSTTLADLVKLALIDLTFEIKVIGGL